MRCCWCSWMSLASRRRTLSWWCHRRECQDRTPYERFVTTTTTLSTRSWFVTHTHSAGFDILLGIENMGSMGRKSPPVESRIWGMKSPSRWSILTCAWHYVVNNSHLYCWNECCICFYRIWYHRGTVKFNYFKASLMPLFWWCLVMGKIRSHLGLD